MVLSLEDLKKDFSINPRIENLEKFPVNIFFDGKDVNDISFLENYFSDNKINIFLRDFVLFKNDLKGLKYQFQEHPIEIRMTRSAYKFFAFDGANLFKQSTIYFY